MPNISFAGAKKRKTRHSGYVFKMSRQEQDYGLPSPSGILSLVDELLLNIIDHIDSREALVTLASTCMRFQSLVEPYIWRDLLVLTGHHARNISQALDVSERRVEYVQSLSVRYEDKHRQGIEELNFFISLMSKLRHLTIESPCPNNSEWRGPGHYFDGYSRIDYTDLLARAVYPRAELPLALPMLQTCKSRTFCDVGCTPIPSSGSPWTWACRPEVPSRSCKGYVLSSQSPKNYSVMLEHRRRAR